MKVRSKTYVMLRYGLTEKAYIHVYPQQRWVATEASNDGSMIGLSRKGIDIEVSKADFEKYFVEIK